MVEIPIAGEAGRLRAMLSDVATNAGLSQGRLFVKVRAESSGAPGQPAVRQIPISIR
jgi:hypothetical protein